MRFALLIAASGLVAFGAIAAETTLVCRGRTTESTLPAQKVGDTAADTLVIDDAKKTVTSDGKAQPVSKFTAQAIEISKVGPKAKALITIDRVTGAYALRITGEDPLVRLTVLGECRDPAQAVPPGERIGTLTGNVYSSPSLGITLKIPAGWETKNAELEKRIASLPGEMSRRTLLTLARMNQEQNPEAMLILTAERVAGDLAAKDYVEAGRAVTRQRAGVSAVSEVAIETIGPGQFATSTITMGSGKDAIFLKTYARRHRDNMLMIVLSYSGTRQRYEAEQMLGSIQYR